MSSSNKTSHLALNQWQRTDPVVMDDFNADNAKVDAALSSLPVVKLFSVTVGTAAQQVDIDLSGVDWSQYAYLHVCADLPGTSENMYQPETRLVLLKLRSLYHLWPL